MACIDDILFELQSIDKLVEKGAKVIWALTDPVNPEKLERNTEWNTMTNEKIDAYNDNALKVWNIFFHQLQLSPTVRLYINFRCGF